MYSFTQIRFYIAIIGILLIAGYFRFTGVAWDQNQHLHPDERFLTMVTESMRFPSSLQEYFNTKLSPLNPHNVGYGFYVYGTWPAIMIKGISTLINMDNYNGITFVGRIASGVIDCIIVLLVILGSYLLTITHTSKIHAQKISLLAGLFYATLALPIQLSHFYTVDQGLVLSTTALIVCAIAWITNNSQKNTILFSCVIAALFGMAVSAKIQGLLLAPLVAGFFIHKLKNTHVETRWIALFLGILIACSTIRIAYPTLFSATSWIPDGLNEKVLDNWKTLKFQYSWDTYKHTSNIYFPPATMFVATRNLRFPVENLLLWGIGIPGSIMLLAGLYLYITDIQKIKKYRFLKLILVLWLGGMFFYQALEFAKYLRYFYIILPLVSMLSFSGVGTIKKPFKPIGIIACIMLFFLHGAWAWAFGNIYRGIHPRIAASMWMNAHIPDGSVITTEHWDDSLPLCLPSEPCGKFKSVELPLYNPDTKEKWDVISKKLANVDYIVLSSNRLYGSIPAVSDRYPQTTAFYTQLFSGNLGFVKVAEFTLRPNISIPFVQTCLTPPGIWYGAVSAPMQECPLGGISFVDDYADESFTVYDHPKVIIFKKNK